MKYINIFLTAIILLFSSCEKFLDEKPDKKLTTPRTVQDLQSLLEDPYVNKYDPLASEASADDYFVNTPEFLTIKAKSAFTANLHIWNSTNLFDPNGLSNEWIDLYRLVVVKTNIVLENIDKIERNASNNLEWSTTKGNALFMRSFQFLNAVGIWGLAYDDNSSNSELGIVLRTSSDVNVKSVRSTVKECYDKICIDLKEAAELLPVKSIHPMRPSKASAYALLARTYLYMRKYDEANKYANLALAQKSDLMDYNSDSEIVGTRTYPISQFNKEVLYHSVANGTYLTLVVISGRVSNTLYAMYTANDLRKRLYFKSAGADYKFYGSYAGSIYPFTGIATDEIYFIRAECNARLGNTNLAIKDLNDLSVKRYDKASFIPFTASNAPNALQIILAERRKELPFRGIRWMDIKRLNKEGANIVLQRNVNSQTFTLQPNSLRYALPIPEDIIAITGMPQNPR